MQRATDDENWFHSLISNKVEQRVETQRWREGENEQGKRGNELRRGNASDSREQSRDEWTRRHTGEEGNEDDNCIEVHIAPISK